MAFGLTPRTLRRLRGTPSPAPAARGPVDPIVSRRLRRPGATSWGGVGSSLVDLRNYGSTGLPPGVTPETAVQGPGITPAESEFYTDVSRLTGLSNRVLAAQGEQEGGADNDFNVHNIGWTDSGPAPVTDLPGWQKPRSAAKLTDKFYRGEIPGYRASEGIQGILNSAGAPDAVQVQALANSGWASDPNYGPRIASLAGGIQAVQPKQGPLGKYSPGGAAATGDGPPQFSLTNQPGQVVSAAEAIGRRGITRRRTAQGGGFGMTPQVAGELAGGLAPQAQAEKAGAKVIDRYFAPEGDADPYNLNPVLARKLIGVAKASGDPIDLTSGYRSSEKQAAIDPGVNPKAPPGYSAHQFGTAADLNSTPAQNPLFEQFGLEHGMAGPGVADTPHTELTDPKLIEKAATFGPVRSGYAPAGLEEAVGDLGDYKSGGLSLGTPGSSGAGSLAIGGMGGSTTGVGGVTGTDDTGAQGVISTVPLAAPVAAGPTLPDAFTAPQAGGVTPNQTASLDDLFALLGGQQGLVRPTSPRRRRGYQGG